MQRAPPSAHTERAATTASVDRKGNRGKRGEILTKKAAVGSGFKCQFKSSAVLCEEEEEKAAEKGAGGGGGEGGSEEGGEGGEGVKEEGDIGGECLELTCTPRTLASPSVTWTITGTIGWHLHTAQWNLGSICAMYFQFYAGFMMTLSSIKSYLH